MGNSVVDLGQGGFRPEISFSGGIMESTPQIASIDGDPVYGDLRTKQASGRIGGSYETSSGDVFGAGVSGGMEKSRLELPSSLQAFGAPARIDRGEGKIGAQSYDAFAELSDVFGIEGAKALIRGNYTPSSRGEDSYEAGVNLSIPFENGGIVGQLGELSEMSSDMRDEISQLVNGTPASGAGFLGYEGSTSFLGNGPNGMFGFSQPAYAEATPLLTAGPPAGSQRPLPPGFGTRPMRDPGNLVDTNATLSLNSLQLPPDFIPPRGMEGMFSPTVSNLDRGSPQIDQGFFNSPEFNAFNSGPQVGTSDMYNSRYFGQMGSGSLGRRQESAYEDYLRRTGQEGSILQPDYNRNVVSLPGSGSGGFGQSIFGFEDGGEVGIMSALLDPRIDLPNSEQQTAVRQSGREGSALSSQFYPEGSLTFEQILETKYGYPSDVDREIYESDSTEVMRAERPRHDLPTYQELEDARAHALQTALLAQDLGPETATKLGGIAEFSDRIFSSATSEDVVMDKRNNAFGAKLLQQAGINATPQQITKMVDDEVFKQLDVVLGREKGERRFKSPESGLDIFFPRDKQGFFNVTR